MTRFALTCAVASVGFALGNSAAVVTYTSNRAAFLTAAGGTSVLEDFSGYNTRTIINPNTSNNTGKFTVTYNLTGTQVADSVSIQTRAQTGGLGPTMNGYRLQTFITNGLPTRGSTVTLTFPEPISAFGADFGIASFTFISEILLSDGTIIDLDALVSGFGTVRFVGFTTTTPITSLTLRDAVNDFNSNSINLDDVVYVPTSSIPEPGGLGALAALSTLALRRRK